jgi:hypothetical protein
MPNGTQFESDGTDAHLIYYSDDGVFDWFRSFRDIQLIFEELIPDKNSRILILGCGNSTLSEEVRCIK